MKNNNKQYYIEHYELIDGNIEIIIRYPSNQILLCYPPKPAPDTVLKRTYGVVDGRIKLLSEIAGKHIPASTTHEQIIFE